MVGQYSVEKPQKGVSCKWSTRSDNGDQQRLAAILAEKITGYDAKASAKLPLP